MVLSYHRAPGLSIPSALKCEHARESRWRPCGGEDTGVVEERILGETLALLPLRHRSYRRKAA
jgi:hypothetical protein